MPPSPTLFERRKSAALRASREVMGFSALREPQDRIIDAVLQDRDVLGIIPTGAGKSATFQIPSLVLPGLTIVISPLISLMKNQTDALVQKGVSAARFTSDIESSESREALRNIGDLNIAYVSPERLKSKDLREALQGVPTSLIVFDEAHTAGQWASDFRPAYSAIRTLVDRYPEAVRLALTATADSHAMESMLALFPLRDPVRVVAAPHRPNLKYRVAFDAKLPELCELVAKHQSKPGSQIVYVSSRAAAEDIAGELRDYGVDAVHYHAGMLDTIRTETQDLFTKGEVRCVVATSAFGMGIDVANIRLVAHWHMPPDVFSYVQGAGRAGRDGLPSVCWLNISGAGRQKIQFFNMLANPEDWVYENLWRSFAKHTDATMYSQDVLARIAGIKEATFQGKVNAALAYLEYTGHIATAPGGVSYRLPIRNPSKAARLAATTSGAKIDGAAVVLFVKPNARDPYDLFVSSGACSWAQPKPVVFVSRKKAALDLDWDALTRKRVRADEAIKVLEQFAESEDKPAFLADCFLAAEG
jgi:RecQ family ATP-dependent DNA helicase